MYEKQFDPRINTQISLYHPVKLNVQIYVITANAILKNESQPVSLVIRFSEILERWHKKKNVFTCLFRNFLFLYSFLVFMVLKSETLIRDDYLGSLAFLFDDATRLS